MTNGERRCRLLIAVLLGGFQDKALMRLLSACWQCCIVPSPTSGEESLQHLPGVLHEVLDTDDLLSEGQELRGWTLSLRRYIRTSSAGHMLRAITGAEIGDNLLTTSVFTMPAEDEEAHYEASEAPEASGNPFAGL